MPLNTFAPPSIRQRSQSLLMLVAMFCAAPLAAADFGDGFESPLKSPPRGLYHSAGPTRTGAPAAMDSTASGSSRVRGTLIRVAWAELHPGPGQFDFDLLDREFERAAALDKRISLGVLDSWNQPAWLLARCATFQFTFRGTTKVACLPWDTAYLEHKAALLQALGERFDANPQLVQVYFTYAAMTNGIEMHWRVDEAAFAAAGYTPTRLADTYAQVFDLHANAFPSTPISIEVHEVFGSAALATSAYAHCRGRIGHRCGVAIWWCARRMTVAPNGESDVWPIAQDAALNSFLTCQTIDNFTQHPESFDEGAGWTPLHALQNEWAFMYAQGANHWELWSVDVTNAEFQSALQDYADLLDP